MGAMKQIARLILLITALLSACCSWGQSKEQCHSVFVKKEFERQVCFNFGTYLHDLEPADRGAVQAYVSSRPQNSAGVSGYSSQGFHLLFLDQNYRVLGENGYEALASEVSNPVRYLSPDQKPGLSPQVFNSEGLLDYHGSLGQLLSSGDFSGFVRNLNGNTLSLQFDETFHLRDNLTLPSATSLSILFTYLLPDSVELPEKVSIPEEERAGQAGKNKLVQIITNLASLFLMARARDVYVSQSDVDQSEILGDIVTQAIADLPLGHFIHTTFGARSMVHIVTCQRMVGVLDEPYQIASVCPFQDEHKLTLKEFRQAGSRVRREDVRSSVQQRGAAMMEMTREAIKKML